MWQGPFAVTRRVGDVDYEVVRSDRGAATQIYHLNRLKAWREMASTSLATTVIESDELGPEVIKNMCGLLLGEVPVHVLGPAVVPLSKAPDSPPTPIAPRALCNSCPLLDSWY
ncbi:hypothetical protein OYC64_010198 [Pagothenia borchgrevinki]|uniref:Integrase p58-like C-terminal domain-containing protein n=1 Tax=Pagothenia borchgrevinki TaxID=8213 RepID=A0ABD2GV28_PAGBO